MDRRGAHARPRHARVSPALPGAGLGRARARGDLAERRRRRWTTRFRRAGVGPASGSRPSASPTSARPRSSGTAPPASRSTAPSSGRTGARPRVCAEARGRGARPAVRETTGLVLDPYFSGTKIALDPRPRARRARARREGRARVRHGRQLTSSSGSRAAQGARHRRHQRVAHAAHEPRARSLGRRRCARSSACRARCCRASSARRSAIGVVTRGLPGCPTASRIAGIAGDQQAALFGQACFDGRRRQVHLRHGRVHARQHRRATDRAADSACSPRSRGRSATEVALRARGQRVHRGRCRAVAPRRARPHQERGRDRGARARACRRATASCSCRRSPGSARPTGIRKRAASSAASRAAPRRRTWRVPRSRASPSRSTICSGRWATISGAPARRMRVDGGAAANDLLMQLQADIGGDHHRAARRSSSRPPGARPCSRASAPACSQEKSRRPGCPRRPRHFVR